MRSSVKRRFASGVSWNFVGTVLAQASVFAANIVIANRIGAHSFGEFSLLQQTALTASALAQFATSVTATRYVAEYRTANPKRAGRVVGFCTLFTALAGSIGALLLFLLSGWLCTRVLGAPELSNGLRIMAVYLLFSVISGFQTGVLSALESYRRIALLSTIHALAHISVVTIGVWFFGMTGALWAIVISLVVKWFLFNRGIAREANKLGIEITYDMDKEERSVLLRFSLPASLGGLTTMPALWLVNATIAQQPSGFSQLGLITAAMNLKAMIMFVPTIVGNVGAVLVYNHHAQNDRSRFRIVYWGNVLASVLAVSFAGLVVIVFREDLLSLYGEGFQRAGPLVVILVVAAIIETLAVALYQLVYSLEKMWWSFFAVTLPKDLLLVLAALLLIPRLGASGIAWAHVIGWCGALLSVLWFVRRYRASFG